MKLKPLFFVFFLNCLILSGQNVFSLPDSKTWVKSGFYSYKDSIDNLLSEKYTPEYAKDKNRAFNGVHGWKGEFIEITSDSTIKMYIQFRNGDHYMEKTLFFSKNFFYSPEDTLEVLLISERCIVLLEREYVYEVYSVYKKRKKIDFCECDIADLIRRRFNKNE
ncbi:MAG: hypothetical protein Q8K92_09085 [Leadbetterella sp.]|nr:hypothetical protein [Leadbetterella sp.]